MNSCDRAVPHLRRRIVLTGGPGAGKTAVLELVQRSLCAHVRVLEAAGDIGSPLVVLRDRGIVFGGDYRDEVPECCRPRALVLA